MFLNVEIIKSEISPKLPKNWEFIARPRDRARGILSSLERQLYLAFPQLIDSLNLPDFLVVGNPQSGTSWLYKCLNSHRQINLTSQKETRYFDRFFHLPLGFYSSLFQPSNHQILGEVNPSYAPLREHRIQYIKKLLPSLKIFFIVRNPIDRTWSHCRRRFSGNNIGKEEICWVLDPQTRPKGDCHVDGWRWHTPSNFKRWSKYFGEESVHLLFFEDIYERPIILLSNIASILHIENEWSPNELVQPVNSNPWQDISPELWLYLFRIFEEEINQIQVLTNRDISHWKRFGAKTSN
ncbi:MAG: sulfotransferase domain-containing protein [Cyanothece sp. SIO1E1]|nr:sulfotransferase domain-containing protein [Cyanothece sp. SIO1E1]